MPTRRRKAERPRQRWLLYVLFAASVLAGVALWAYSPSLPAETLIARYTNDHSRFVDVGGVRAHVRDQGNPDGVPVVLIHGSLASLHVWEGWARELGSTVRVISVDLPGHGLTGPWPRDEYTIEAYTDFIEVLIDNLHLDRVVLVGHSMGGAVAWSFAATRPDRVIELVLVDAAGYPRQGEAPLSARLARTSLLGDVGIFFKPEGAVRRSLGEIYADPATVTPDRVKRYAELQRFPGNREATLQRTRAQEPLDPTPLKRMDVPTLILWGAKDQWVPAADAFRFQNDIKGAKLEIFENLGHNPMEEDPKTTVAAVLAFMADAPTPTPLPEQPSAPPAASDPTGEHTVQPSVVPEKD
jgi:pimeloyl-ACP methyl ester carboxylesterase